MIPASRLRLALLLSLLLPAPAPAVVVRGGPGDDEARLEAEAHAEGARLTAVAGLQVRDGSGPGPGTEPRAWLGTATLFGMSPDGRRGYLLTAAHCLVVRSSPAGRYLPTGEVQVLFGPVLRSGRSADPLAVLASRAFLHPQLRRFRDFSEWGGQGRKRQPNDLFQNDLAVLEIELDGALAVALDRAGVRPLPLHAGPVLGTVLREARLAGFGCFGTQAGDRLFRPGRVHAGSTRVTGQAWGGTAVYAHWLPAAAGMAIAFRDWRADPEVHHLRFKDQPEAAFWDPATGTVVPAGSHPRQALGAPGDSGGPLVFQTRNGPRLAGVYSSSRQTLLQPLPGPGKPRRFFCQVWTPVADALPWIEACLAGEEAPGPVLDFREPPPAQDLLGLDEVKTEAIGLQAAGGAVPGASAGAAGGESDRAPGTPPEPPAPAAETKETGLWAWLKSLVPRRSAPAAAMAAPAAAAPALAVAAPPPFDVEALYREAAAAEPGL